MSLTVGSLFSGVGGFDLGFERAGMAVRWQCEIDPAARGVLRRHWPDVTMYEDVRDVGSGAEPVDVVVGGFPCQDVSVAGRRAGLAGERSGLWFEFHRVLGELAPEWVVIENVPGLLSSNGGRDFAILLRGLVEFGYGVVWRVLDSSHFGVPQRRRRVFIVGHSRSGAAAQVLFERDGGGGHPAPGGSAGQAIANSPAGIAGTVSSKWAKGTGGPAGDEAYNLIAFEPRYYSGRDGMAGAPNPLTGPLKSTDYKAGDSQQHVFAFTNRHGQHDHVTETLRAGSHAALPPLAMPHEIDPVYYSHDRIDRFVDESDRIRAIQSDAKSSTAQEHIYFKPNAVVNSLEHARPTKAILPAGVRRLTPLECERLQSFPDGWTEPQSDSARYRQLGNAVTVNVAEWIGRRIVGVSVP